MTTFSESFIFEKNVWFSTESFHSTNRKDSQTCSATPEQMASYDSLLYRFTLSILRLHTKSRPFAIKELNVLLSIRL